MRSVDPPADFFGVTNIFEAIRKSDLMVHHPYESFSPVVEFLNQAAIDSDVLAIKQTLYRVSGNSPIIDALIEAAKNGKQVTVLFELKARFDEENNINWAKKLEKAGCHVIYGLHGLKIHCKILLVVRREESGILRYMHIGTGNYNDITAKSYTDLGLFTSNEAFGADASSLFNVLTGYSRPPKYNKMIVAPNGLRQTFEKLIKREIKHAKKGIMSSITVKVNSLVDPQIISLLYDASSAGVKVELIVRGICCLIPGVPGVSDNIKVISIVGKLLEHSRIFRFQNGADPKIYIGSADFMPRNFDRRVELVIPVEDQRIFRRVDNILKLMLEDNKNARVKLKDTSYAQVIKGDDPDLDSQELFFKLAAKELEKMTIIDHNKPFRPIRKKLKTEEVI
jgi:polyphosphate kinase